MCRPRLRPRSIGGRLPGRGRRRRPPSPARCGSCRRGSSLRPRRPNESRWTRRRHPSSASPASLTTWNGSITVTASGSSSPAAVLNPLNPSIATTWTPSRQAWERAASQVLNTALERPSTMSSNRAGPVLVTHWGQVDDHSDVLVAVVGVPPDVLVAPEHPHPLEPARVIEEHSASLRGPHHWPCARTPQDLPRCATRSDGRPPAPPAPTASRDTTASPARAPPL